MPKIVKSFLEFIKPSSSYDIVMRNAIYFILFMIFTILILPYIKLSGVTGTGKVLEISQPSDTTLKFFESILKDLFFYVLGAYAINKIGWQMTISIISFAVMKTGGDINKALDALSVFLDIERKSKNTNDEEVLK